MPPIVAVIVGTRPEAVKMAPVIRALSAEHDLEQVVISTGQHREMLDQILGGFGLRVDEEMALMAPNQTLYGLTARAITAFEEVLARRHPDLLLVQGDTTTAFLGALAAFYRKTPVAHVEAGLRTFDKYAPYPEEVNRRLISVVADLHFAPTEANRRNLLAQGVPDARVQVTGNTVIDALLQARELTRDRAFPVELGNRRLVLVTAHRRESFGGPLESVMGALRELAERNPEIEIVYPVHLNPNVQAPARRLLDGVPNVHLIEPLDYFTFVALMARATLVLTDSGGVQEEAPSLGVPVLVLRDVTERAEAIEAGTVRLVGTDRARILAEAQALLDSTEARERMARAVNPYGDGHAAARIVAGVRRLLGLPVDAESPPFDSHLRGGA